MDLRALWFVLLGILLSGYAILDGFDLGVGILHLGARDDRERRLFMNSIGPLWDGNEVWLVTFGGALFAAFPEAYATAFSAFYLPFMLLLFALIFRAVSMEFRGKRSSPLWRGAWDVSFSAASFLAALLFGVAVGDSMLGIPIARGHEFAGGFLDLLRPYALLVGALNVSLFTLHGAIYLNLKTGGELQRRVRRWAWHAFGIFLTLYLFTTIVTLVSLPRAIANFQRLPWLWGAVAVNVLALANIPRSLFLRRPGQAFLSSAASIAALIALFGAALYPNLIVSSLNPDWSLTVVNASSSAKTLGIMAVIALCGMPFVLAYTAVIYWVFRGRVELGKFSY
ncbi:MAG: cytochrome d ubiquinol oxidase subunit II [Elusimicrobia bacterium]|nr:cytochrome d ubiquinol oxidase subunit II [Elusimicrobiota bacterium]MDE2425984.1 cytochrome d ubiquinol oxidase subunit II [Elusimicrobiota bacterium]